jgi:hypothetical protein
MAGRTAGYRHIEETRLKIQASAIINRLMSHVEADKPIMDASQVNAAKALLNKVLPDLSSVSLDNTPDEDGNPTELLISVIKADRS